MPPESQHESYNAFPRKVDCNMLFFCVAKTSVNSTSVKIYELCICRIFTRVPGYQLCSSRRGFWAWFLQLIHSTKNFRIFRDAADLTLPFTEFSEIYNWKIKLSYLSRNIQLQVTLGLLHLGKSRSLRHSVGFLHIFPWAEYVTPQSRKTKWRPCTDLGILIRWPVVYIVAGQAAPLQGLPSGGGGVFSSGSALFFFLEGLALFHGLLSCNV